jgi:hypothetical protein
LEEGVLQPVPRLLELPLAQDHQECMDPCCPVLPYFSLPLLPNGIRLQLVCDLDDEHVCELHIQYTSKLCPHRLDICIRFLWYDECHLVRHVAGMLHKLLLLESISLVCDPMC